jgi:hypothetical protein
MAGSADARPERLGAADSLDEAKAAFRAAWERPLSGASYAKKTGAAVQELPAPASYLFCRVAEAKQEGSDDDRF